MCPFIYDDGIGSGALLEMIEGVLEGIKVRSGVVNGDVNGGIVYVFLPRLCTLQGVVGQFWEAVVEWFVLRNSGCGVPHSGPAGEVIFRLSVKWIKIIYMSSI